VDSEDKDWSGQNWALLTLLMLLSTPSGVTSPTTVTFFVAISMSKELTPSILEMCFFTLPAHPLQCRDTLSTTTWCWPLLVEQDLVMAVLSPPAARRPVSDDDKEEEEDDAPADGSANNSTGGASSCGHAGTKGRDDVPSPRPGNLSSSMNAGRGDGRGGKESSGPAAVMSSSSMNEGRRGDDGSGGRESTTVMSSSDCSISLDELSRNLEELAGLTSCSWATACFFLFFLRSDGVEEPPPAAAAPSALFFFLLSLPSSWWW